MAEAPFHILDHRKLDKEKSVLTPRQRHCHTPLKEKEDIVMAVHVKGTGCISPALSPSATPSPSRSNSFTLPSPTGSDTCAPTLVSVSPLQSTTKGLTDQKENDQRKISEDRLSPRTTNVESPKEKLSEQKENFDPHKVMENPSRSCTSGIDASRVSLNRNANICENELGKLFSKNRNDSPFKAPLQGPGMVTVDPKFKGPVPLLKDSKVSCKTESSTRTPLLRAVSWEHAEPGNIEKAPFKSPSEDDNFFPISNKSSNLPTKTSAFKDLQIQVQPVRMQKLTKLREEHKLMRNQNLVGLKLPDLSEAAEQEREAAGRQAFAFEVTPQHPHSGSHAATVVHGPEAIPRQLGSCWELLVGPQSCQEAAFSVEVKEFLGKGRGGSSPIPFLQEEDDEVKTRCDVMPNIPDTLLRKLRVHTSIPGSSPALTEREVENVFVQLSLAFRNDSYTLESRINQAERERNLAEENTEKELDHFKAAITSSAALWHHSEHRDMYQRLLEDITVLNRLSSRLSSRAEMVGAVRQEKRMSKATEVMMQYVENLKRTYEKDHAELMEYKKLANQNSSRSYGSPEDGVPRTSRSMSLSVGKMPRRRVSVAVVSKFELPGQSPGTSPVPLMPSSLTHSGIEDISPETKAKIEEEAYNKGYQEGLKKTKELEELKEDDEDNIDESPNDCVADENDDEVSKEHSKLEVVIQYIQILYPKLHKHWTMLWVVAAIILIFAVVLGISTLYNYFSSCTELSDGTQMKATCSAVQQYSWWNSGLQHEQRTE
ncbi:hypothetical protein JD844_021760 [Phrynosoma platyrhinos]|uniref:Protein MRVI1 n=1 Tax=Phrynosoma platyrhinos TaxID=52577 RepID=A0ABQ7SU67_PHRPL|nr:hypothetical protein JD844_021760 [Phrynosoma platyrhinos]